jgi:hypothetical protein
MFGNLGWKYAPGFSFLMDEGGGAAAAQPAAEPVSAAESQPESGKTFTQADIDRIVKDRLEREKSAREKATAKAKEEAEAEALKKNQEWQALAEKNETRANELLAKLGELEPLGDQVTRYKGALEKYLATEKKDLPKHVLVLLEKLDPIEQIEYLAANREDLGKAGRVEGVPPSPDPKQRTLSDDEKEAARRGQASLYSNF